MRTKKRGFTLIELIVVIIIVGILSAIAVPMISTMKARAVATEAVMGVSAMRQVLRNSSLLFPRQMIRVSFSYGLFSPPGILATINQGDFNGTYFSSECYYGLMVGEIFICRCYFRLNTSAKAGEIDAMKDDPADQAYIDISNNGRITQYNFSRSGYPRN